MKRVAALVLWLALLAGLAPPGRSQSTGFTWGIVVSADGSEEQAQVEARQVQQRLGLTPRFFRCNNWIRTVILVTDRREAARLLSAAQQQIRPSSYLVDMRLWCPGKVPLSLRER